MLILGLILSLIQSAIGDNGLNWALLVAGSNEFRNYRHQVFSYLRKKTTKAKTNPLNRLMYAMLIIYSTKMVYPMIGL